MSEVIFGLWSQLWSQLAAVSGSRSSYRRLIGQRQALSGQPVADPYLIAAAKINGYTVVSEEEAKPNSAKIPIVCKHYRHIADALVRSFGVVMQNIWVCAEISG